MNKLVFKTTSWQVYTNMDSSREVWVIKDDWEKSAGGNIHSCDELVIVALPEHKNTTMCMVSGKSKLRIKFVIRVEGATIFWDEKVGGNGKIRLEKPWL